MGKENELVKSYFHTRKIAAEQDSKHSLVPYEIKYLIDSGKMEIKNLTENEIYSFLMDFPDYFNKIAAVHDFDKLDYYIPTHLVMKHPQLIDKINWKRKWKGIEGHQYESAIIAKYPQFINYFDVTKFHGDDISKIIEKNPKLVTKFEKEIKEEIDGYISWKADNIIKILNVRPDIKDWFKYGYMSSEERIKLLWYHPEVIDNLFALYKWENMKKLQYKSIIIDKMDRGNITLGGILYGDKRTVWLEDLLDKHPQLVKYFPDHG